MLPRRTCFALITVMAVPRFLFATTLPCCTWRPLSNTR